MNQHKAEIDETEKSTIQSAFYLGNGQHPNERIEKLNERVDREYSQMLERKGVAKPSTRNSSSGFTFS
jgi:hypothetical protein